MTKDLISSKEAAKIMRILPGSVIKRAKKHGVPVHPGMGRHKETFINKSALMALIDSRELEETANVAKTNNGNVFYVIQLMPDLAANRVKCGFSTDVNGRLASYRETNWHARILATWRCPSQDVERVAHRILKKNAEEVHSECYVIDPDRAISVMTAFFESCGLGPTLILRPPK